MVRKITALLLAAHFAVVIVMILFDYLNFFHCNVIPSKIETAITNALNPYAKLPHARQSWHMFSPPPNHNHHVLYQFIMINNQNSPDTSQWFSATKGSHTISKRNFLLSVQSNCMSSMLFHEIQPIIKNLAAPIDSIGNEFKDVANDHHKRLMNYGSLVWRKSPLASIKCDTVMLRYKIVFEKLNYRQDTIPNIFGFVSPFEMIQQ